MDSYLGALQQLTDGLDELAAPDPQAGLCGGGESSFERWCVLVVVGRQLTPELNAEWPALGRLQRRHPLENIQPCSTNLPNLRRALKAVVADAHRLARGRGSHKVIRAVATEYLRSIKRREGSQRSINLSALPTVMATVEERKLCAAALAVQGLLVIYPASLAASGGLVHLSKGGYEMKDGLT